MNDQMPGLFDFDEDFSMQKKEEAPKQNIESPDANQQIVNNEEPVAPSVTLASNMAFSLELPEADDIEEAIIHTEGLEIELPEATSTETTLVQEPEQEKWPAIEEEEAKPIIAFENSLAKEAIVQEPETVEPTTTAETIIETATDDEKEETTSDLPEWQLDKQYYTIGEVAKMFDVRVSHIRFWTTEFKMKPRTTRKGDRLYTPNQIAELRLIHHLVKVKKHTIKGAREILKNGEARLEKKLDIREELQKLYDTLSELKESL